MPQRDANHQAVRQALIKDGWHITDDPLVVKYKGLHLYIDLAAEKIIGPPEQPEKIAIEIKVFGGLSFINEFEKAVGQYHLYRDMLQRTQTEHKLYLAVPEPAFTKHFLKAPIQEFMQAQQIHLLLFDPVKEDITQWLN